MRFKPKIMDIIKDYCMDPLLLVPKNGGLKRILAETVGKLGVEFRDDIRYKSGGVEVLKYRGEDIAKITEEYYASGVKAIGLTGDDLFDEYIIRHPRSVVRILETFEWDDERAIYRRPALCVLVKDENISGKVNVAVNRKYEATSRQFLDEVREDWGMDPVVRVYSGNLEYTVNSGINDMCIEIVYSGNAVKENNLKIRDKVRCSDFVMIGAKDPSSSALEKEYGIVQSRIEDKDMDPESSCTKRLAQSANNAQKKIGEEAVELAVACRDYFNSPVCERRSRVIEEYCDLLYVMNVNAALAGVSFEEIEKEMYRRMKK